MTIDSLAYRIDTWTEDQVAAECPFPRGVRLDFATRQSPEAMVLAVADRLKLPVVVYATHVWADLSGTTKTPAAVRKQWSKIVRGLESEHDPAPEAAADEPAADGESAPGGP